MVARFLGIHLEMLTASKATCQEVGRQVLPLVQHSGVYRPSKVALTDTLPPQDCPPPAYAHQGSPRGKLSSRSRHCILCVPYLLAFVGLLPRPLTAEGARDSLVSLPPTHALSLPATSNVVVLPPLGPDDLEQLEASQARVTWSGITRSLPRIIIAQHFENPQWGWTDTSSGPVWRLQMTSRYARGTRLHFTNLDLGSGRLWISSDARSAAGPYSGRGPHGDGKLWSPIIEGERLLIEYDPGSTAGAPDRARLPFTLSAIGHLWNLPTSIQNYNVQPDIESTDLTIHGPETMNIATKTVRVAKYWMKAEGLSKRDRKISLGIPIGFNFPTSKNPTIHLGNRSFRFNITDNIRSIELAINSKAPDALARVFLRLGSDNEVSAGRVVSDIQLDTPTEDGILTLSRNSNPPLQSGTYFLSLGTDAKKGNVEGSIMITPRATISHCFQDAACRTQSNPQIDHSASAVARIDFVDDQTRLHGVCTGALINDRDPNTDIPYFLTAAHCIGSDSEARSIQLHWFYQTLMNG